MSEKNRFGGGNANSLYVPMSETEQEVLHRIAQDLRVIVHGWGFIDRPQVIIGDARVGVVIDMTFHKPETPQPVHFFDLELQTQTGYCLFKKRMPLAPNGDAMLIGAGLHLVMSWDIMIHHMDPAFVKMIKPGALGLTSRRIDKDTKEASFTGNMRLSQEDKKLLNIVNQGEAKVRGMDLVDSVQSTQNAGYEVKTKDGKIIAQDVK